MSTIKAPTQTTLSAAVTASAINLPMTAVTSMTVGMLLAIGSELVRIQSINTVTLVVGVARAQLGTYARQYASGAIVTLDTTGTLFGIPQPTGLIGGQARIPLTGQTATDTLPQMTLPIGGRHIDLATGYEYTLVWLQQASNIGSWQVIDQAGNATPCNATAKGRVGILVETVGSSGNLAFLLTRGLTASALLTSNVTTACYLIAGSTDIASILTSTDGSIIYGATCTVAPSSATDLGTVYIDDAWVYGVAVAFSST